MTTHGSTTRIRLKIVALNCGRAGLAGDKAAVISEYLREVSADVIVLTEVHLRPGNHAALPGYNITWQPRPGASTTTAPGGVAIGVRDGLLDAPGCLTPVVEARSRHADVLLVKLHVGIDVAPLFIAGVYFPPGGSARRTCTCSSLRCQRVHVQLALDELSQLIQRCKEVGPVIASGDFNARWAAPGQRPSPRQLSVSTSVLAVPGVTLVNPVDGAGRLVGTRRDPSTGTETVLDLTLFASDTCFLLCHQLSFGSHNHRVRPLPTDNRD